jgi:hypothetical protein
MSENSGSNRPLAPRRAALVLPFFMFALIALAVGLLASRTRRSPYQVPFFHLFFSDTLHMKAWLSSAALLLGVSQLLTASRIYGLFHFPPAGDFYGPVHRWLGRAAILLTLPAAYHCIFMLGFGTEGSRVFIHSILGSCLYGAFFAKVWIVRTRGFPGYALPIAGGVVFSILLGIWLTSALWLFRQAS